MTTDYLLKDELEQPDAQSGASVEMPEESHRWSVTLDEANAYLDTVQAVRKKLAAGVGLCILSPIALFLLGAWADGTASEDRMAGLGVVILLVVVALGLLLILPAAIRLEAFEYLEKEELDLAYGVAGIVERKKQEYAPTYRRSMTQGVVLCVLAVVPILGTAMLGAPDFWVVAAVGLLLAIVAGAVQLFIRAGMTQGSFDKLLQTGEYTIKEKWTNRRVGWFAGAYWCLVTAVYLAVSFWNNNWKKAGSSGPWPGLSLPPSTPPSVRGQTEKIGKAPTNSQFIHCNSKVVWYTQAKATQGGQNDETERYLVKKGTCPVPPEWFGAGAGAAGAGKATDSAAALCGVDRKGNPAGS